MARWFKRKTDINIELMSKQLRISPILAKILANKGIRSKLAAEQYLNPELNHMPDVSTMKDIDKGVQLIVKTVLNRKKIVIYGDYDVDGVMSTVILYKALKHYGADICYYIPKREEGYGLNRQAIQSLYEQGIELVIACDNGIAAYDEISFLKELGMKIIVIDHHEPGFHLSDHVKTDIIPKADAVINPKQSDCKYPFKYLCAAGICYKFVKYFYHEADLAFQEEEYLIFAAIATVCDIVDLIGENRIIVKFGLDLIERGKTNNLGLKVLMEKRNLLHKNINTFDMGYIIGPCINAAGRLDHAELSVGLFISDDREEAERLADRLINFNEERKLLTSKAVDLAISNIEQTDLKEDKVLVYYEPEIHESIAGIVAGRIKEKIDRPTIVLTNSGDLVKGSARSIEGYNIFEALYQVKDLFERFGGHAMAAGLSLKFENISILRDELNKSCTLNEEDFIPVIRIDEELHLDEITYKLADELSVLEPYGKENKEPVFGTKNITADLIEIIGSSKTTLRFVFTIPGTGRKLKAVCFHQIDRFKQMLLDTYGESAFHKFEYGRIMNINLDMVYHIEINDYQNNKYVNIKVIDFRLHNNDMT